jgi:hypothetical protein
LQSIKIPDNFASSKPNGNFIIEGNSINNLFSNYQIDNSTSVDNSTNKDNSSSVDNSTNIDLHDIFIEIDKSDNSPEQKEMIKQILNSLNKDIKTKPLPQILTSLALISSFTCSKNESGK